MFPGHRTGHMRFARDFRVGTPIKKNKVTKVLSGCQPDSRYPAL